MQSNITGKLTNALTESTFGILIATKCGIVGWAAMLAFNELKLPANNVDQALTSYSVDIAKACGGHASELTTSMLVDPKFNKCATGEAAQHVADRVLAKKTFNLMAPPLIAGVAVGAFGLLALSFGRRNSKAKQPELRI